ncbi:hypothetical protein MC885_003773 [Smutsia gigantea]|nr:hypothetical protein MC885_003773 [Smutsia gigantea]
MTVGATDHRRMPQLVEERLGHSYFGEDLVQDRGSRCVIGDSCLCQLQPVEGELGLQLSQLEAGREKTSTPLLNVSQLLLIASDKDTRSGGRAICSPMAMQLFFIKEFSNQRKKSI